MATYGDFPGVQVTTQSGGVPSVNVGAEEKLVLFGQANYNSSHNVDGDDPSKSATANEPRQINAPLEADQIFGSGSELAEAMKKALDNGANIDYLYGVAVSEVAVSGETQSSQTGSLNNLSIHENTDTIDFDDGGTLLNVEFRYNGAPNTPSTADTVFINPLTGEYAADSAPGTDFSVDYEYYDYNSAFTASDVRNVVNEDETGIYWALSDSDAVSADLDSEVSTLRDNYQLVTGFCFAEPNDSETLADTETTAENGGANALYDPVNYGSANQSVSSEYFYKLAPARLEGVEKTIGGGVGGVYAGNSITDAVYNELVTGYGSLEQSFSRTEAQDMRNENIVPIRSAGSIRVRGNRSTAYDPASGVADEFWTRRIADRVILIAKQIGDEVIGRINDQETRRSAERLINAEMQNLVADRLIRPNTQDTQYWNVDVYEDSGNDEKINIDIYFTPYGIAKEVDASVTVNL